MMARTAESSMIGNRLRPDTRSSKPTLEPSWLVTFRNSTLKLHGRDTSGFIELFVAENLDTEEKLGVSLSRESGVVEVKTAFDELLFQAAFKLGEEWIVSSAGELKIGCVQPGCDAITDFVNKVTISVAYSSDNNADKHGRKYQLSLAKQNIASIHLGKGYLHISLEPQNLENSTKALILTKAVQLLVENYPRNDKDLIDESVITSPYVCIPLQSASPLSLLKDVSQVRIQAVGSTKFKISYFDGFCGKATTSDARGLLFEYDHNNQRLQMLSSYGTALLYVDNFLDDSEKLYVNLHKRKTIGNICADMLINCSYPPHRLSADASRENPLELPIDFYRSSRSGDSLEYQEPVSLVFIDAPKEDGFVCVKFSNSLTTSHKALALVQALRIACKTYGFIQHPPIDLHRCYRAVRRGDTHYPGTLHCIEINSVKASMHKSGYDKDKGITYVEVSMGNSEVTCIFEVLQLLGDVSATAKNAYGEPQFSVFGLWDMDTNMEMYCNSQAFLGGIFNNTLMNHKCNEVGKIKDYFRDEQGVEKSSEKPLPSVYQISATLGKKETMAEININNNEVSISFGKRLPVVESHALILCYALKLFYRHGLHKHTMPNKCYDYASRPSTRLSNWRN